MPSRLSLAVILCLAGVAMAQPAVVPYPREYRARLLKYAVVDRADGVSRDLYVSRAAVDSLTRDPRRSELPVGTLFALDVHSARQLGRDQRTGASVFATDRNGRLVRSKDEPILHLMQKTRAGLGSSSWAFGGYEPDTGRPLKLELPGDCLLCHQAALTSDMAFSLSLLKQYVATGAVQYRFCAHPGRQMCSF